jgi:hypothetical protein
MEEDSNMRALQPSLPPNKDRLLFEYPHSNRLPTDRFDGISRAQGMDARI